jgi:HlyD family secretion protein
MKKRIPIVILVLVAAGFGGWYFRQQERTRHAQELRLYGNVDIREVNLGFRVPGRLAEVLRDEGDTVTRGELLARLDDAPYQKEVEEARAQVAALRARVELLQAGNRAQEIAQARAQMHEREVSAANAERTYRRYDELHRTQAISQQERDDAEARFREASARLSSAREQLNLLEAGFRAEEKAQASAELSRAEAALASAELRLQDTRLEASADGVVLTRSQEPGAILQMGTAVLSVSLVKPVWVRAYIDEPDLGRIHPGMKVSVRTDSRPAQPYHGHIGYISPRAEFTPKNVETPQLRTALVFRFRVVVEDPDAGLRQGMPVTVELEP